MNRPRCNGDSFAAIGAVRCCEVIGLDSGPISSTNRYAKINMDASARCQVDQCDRRAAGAVVVVVVASAVAVWSSTGGVVFAGTFRFCFLFFELMTL